MVNVATEGWGTPGETVPPGATGVPKGDPIRRYDNGMGAYVYVFADGSEETDWGGDTYGETPKAASGGGGGGGGGSTVPHTQMVQDPVTGQWILVDSATGQPIGDPVGTAKPPNAPETQTQAVNGQLYERTQNPDGSWGPWKLSEGLPGAKAPTTIKDTGKGGTIAITENPDGTFTTTTIIPDQADPPKTQVIDGVLYQYDEVSKTWKTTGVGTSSSAAALANTQMQISANAAENAAGRAFTAGENAANRAFQSAEAEAARVFTAKENALGRELDAKQFAAQFGLDTIRFLAEVDKNRAEAAKAFSEVVSSTDPSALPGYLAAQGGGSLSNAVAAGGDMITDAALLPGARLLGLARKEAPALPTFDAGAWAVGGAGTGTGGLQRTTRGGRGSRFGGSGEGGGSGRGAGMFEGSDRMAQGLYGASVMGGTASEVTEGLSTMPDGRMYFTDKRGNIHDYGYPSTSPFREGGLDLDTYMAGKAQRKAHNAKRSESRGESDRDDLPVVFAAGGFTGTVDEPTAFVAGEAGPEDVQVTPLGRPSLGDDRVTGAISGFQRGATPFGGPRRTPQAPGAPPIGAPPPPAQGAAPGAPPPPQGAPPPPAQGAAPGAPPPPRGAPQPPSPTTGFGQPAPATGASAVASGLGAAGYGLGGYVPTAEERALMNEVRGIRTGVKLPWEDERYFNNVAWANEDPILQQMMMKGLQAKRGIPQESLWAEARRNALSGLGRQAVGIGY